MDASTLEKAMSQAAEIAAKLPTNLQEAAFNRALDALLGTAASSSRSQHGSSRVAPKFTKKAGGKAVEADASNDLLEAIDRTRYPDVGATTRNGDRALKVLQLAHSDFGIDGLTAAEIANILSKKFRLPANSNSIQVALNREVGTVDTRKGADGTRTFHIMEPGELYLSELRAGRKEPTPPSRGKRAKPGTRKSDASPVPAPRSKSAKRRVATRPGPKVAITDLVAAGFFKTGKLIADVQEELRHRRGHQYTLQDLSPALVRCLRDGLLSRDRNDTGQYEYRQV